MQTAVVIGLWALIVIAVVLFSGWIWMLALGVAAHVFHNPDLALSYKQSIVVALFVNMILGSISARFRKS